MDQINNREDSVSEEYEKLMGTISVLRNVVYVVLFLGAGFTTYYNLVIGQEQTNNKLNNHIKINQLYEKRYESDNALHKAQVKELSSRVRDLEESQRIHQIADDEKGSL